MARSWQQAEITYLKRYGTTKTPKELAQRFETTVAEVKAEMKGLGLGAGTEGTSIYDDPVIETFQEALQALHKKKWKNAAGKLEEVLEKTDQPEVAARARQYLRMCQSQLESPVADDGGDPFLRAVVLKNRGDLDDALKIAKGAPKDDDRFIYLTASIHALQHDVEKAEKALSRAVEINPKNRVYAYHDPDFSQLREHEEYAHLFTAP